MRSPSIRVRVTLAVALPPVLLLAVFSVLVYDRVRADRLADLDASLRARAAALVGLVERDHGTWDVDLEDGAAPGAGIVGSLAAWAIEADGHVIAASAPGVGAALSAVVDAPEGEGVPRVIGEWPRDAPGTRGWVFAFAARSDDARVDEHERGQADDDDEDRGTGAAAEATAPSSALGPAVASVYVATDLAPLEGDLADLGRTLLQVGGVMCCVGLAVGLSLSRRIVGPVERMVAIAESVTTPPDHDPLPVDGSGDEFDRLAQTLNRTFARLRAAWDRQGRFTANASHELRTPLALIRTQAEVALRRERTVDVYKDALGGVLVGARRMQDLVEGLLLLARVDSLSGKVSGQVVDLVTVAREASVGVPGRDVSLDVPSSATVIGDPVQLRIVIQNLVSNAVRHTAPNGEVCIAIRGEGSSWTLEVRDAGEGIAADALAHVFEPFFRVDEARGRDQGGAGLGLAIVKAVAEAHGGAVAIVSQRGAGTTVRVTLPAARCEPVG